ncbi:hypothetical protein SAMN06296378_2076 [Salinibacterium xinjiangense]|uniref:Uncharacterized protein n=1 Tax=Salinibacterium xinjiangense TaxID=386302 RepID=A0A2C8ZVW5_9MICO|nr:hypothetical protein [Salinibacterium xinjiangense]SOE69857.1 hypothetical protein SAMN06296378_2076 [Salinibacterium xinjiangense]
MPAWSLGQSIETMLRKTTKPAEVSLANRPRCDSRFGYVWSCVHRLTLVLVDEVDPSLELAIPGVVVWAPFEVIQGLEKGHPLGCEAQLMAALLPKPPRQSQLIVC